MTVFQRAALVAALSLAALGTALAHPHGEPAPAASVTGPSGALLPRDSVEAKVFRGGLVYANYCVTCHGINADGNGRAARLYTPRPANLRASDKNDDYFALIIRRGGEAIGRSAFMPPWVAELTDEQVGDLVSYLRSINVAGR